MSGLFANRSAIAPHPPAGTFSPSNGEKAAGATRPVAAADWNDGFSASSADEIGAIAGDTIPSPRLRGEGGGSRMRGHAPAPNGGIRRSTEKGATC